MDYAPETIADPAWTGLADPESVPGCRMHDLLPNKAVAFEGTSIVLCVFEENNN
jgi:hypothetical protein